MTSLFRRCRVGVAVSLLVGAIAMAVVAVASAQTTETAAPPAAAQVEEPPAPPAEPPPGYIVGVEGSAVLEREGTSGEAITGMPLLVGDRVRSEGGAIEIKWAERSVLKLARYSEVDLLSRSMVRVPRGRVTIEVIAAPGESVHDQLMIDAPGASVRFYAAGEYQIAVSGTDAPDVELAVIRGSAQLASDRGRTMLADSQRALVRDGSIPSRAEAYVASAAPDAEPLEAEPAEMMRDLPEDETAPQGAYDPSDDLAAFQRSSAGGAYYGTSYLPTELYGYETVLSSYGRWQTHPSYGHVWYPRVGHDWRPYYRGRWHHVPRYGWTWIGAERWAWPTHHYGRWGFHNTHGWFWVPARKWGPAWVSWAVAPSYVSWCPLGWDGRPVFSFFNVNTVIVARGHHNPWRGWTVIPSRSFGHRFAVPRHRVDHRIIVRDRPAFIHTWGPPRHPGRGVVTERGVRASAGPSTGAVPRRSGIGDRRSQPGMSGFSNGRSGNAQVGVGAVPRDVDRDESPYDRALRVMQRRSTSGNVPIGGFGLNGPTNEARPRHGTSGNVPIGGFGLERQPSDDNRDNRGGVQRWPGHSGTDDGRRGAVPRHAMPSRPSDNRPSSVDDDGTRGVPYRQPGYAGPRRGDSPRQPGEGGYVHPRRQAPDRGGDDGNRSRGSGSAMPRHANPPPSPPPSAEPSRDGGGRPSGYAGPRHGGGSNNNGGGRGGSNDGGSRAGSSDGGGGRQGGGAVRRHR